MSHRMWVVLGGCIGLAGWAAGVGCIAAGWRGLPWGVLLILAGVAVLLGSQVVAFRIYGDHRNRWRP